MDGTKLDYLKTLSLQACESLRYIASESVHLQRQSKCADYLRYALDTQTHRMALNKASFCKQRSCPICCWLRSVKWRIRIFQGLPGLLRDYPEYHFIFLTLTVRNCHAFELRTTIKSMQQSWNRLLSLPTFPAIGCLKTVEVTRPRDCFYAGYYLGRFGVKLIKYWITQLKQCGMWNAALWSEYYCEEVHPHFHCLLMVAPDYFDAAHYIDRASWAALWRRAARLDYDPVVDIRKVQQLDSAIFEVSKYCLKTSDMVDHLGCLIIRQLHGLRLLAPCGVFTDYFSQATIDAIDSTMQLGNEVFQTGVPCWYQWDGDGYALTRLGSQEWIS